MGFSDNEKIKEYLSSVCSQIKFKEAHNEVKLELENHIKEIIEEYLSRGLSKEEAESKAIFQMGNPSDIGKKLNKVHKLKPDWSILLLTLLFVGLGLTSMYFIGAMTTLGTSNPLFLKSSLFALIGLAITIGLYLFDYRKIKPFSTHIYAVSTLLLLLTILSGTQINGQYFLSFGSLHFNFVAVSPFLFVISLAGVIDKWNWKETRQLLIGILLLFIPLILILAARSLSTGIIYFVVMIVLMIASGLKVKKTIILLASGLTLLAIPIFTAPYRLQRLITFLNPNKDPLGAGYINIQLTKMIQGSGLMGQGFKLEVNLIPEIHTNFIFAYITHSLGWVIGFIIAALILTFLVRVVLLARLLENTYSKLLTSGFAAILALQFFWNIFMNLGLAPISGISLPFLSYGGSQMIFNMLGLGMILSIKARKNYDKSSKAG